jgi:hypothetical protein
VADKALYRDELTLERLLDSLAADRHWSYRPGGPRAAEPAALTALALLAHGRQEQSLPALQFLHSLQLPDGKVPVSSGHHVPVWTTAWALVAWSLYCACDLTTQEFAAAVQRAKTALLHERGVGCEATGQLVGHDTRLVGWPWVAQTHSWIEPTALAVLALAAAGCRNHPRVVEGVKLLLDRQLPCGGWNYGNKVVLGNTLRPHVQPSAIATLALFSQPTSATAVHRAIAFLQSQWSLVRSPVSFSWCWLALAAHHAISDDAAWRVWLTWLKHPPACAWGTYHRALLAWAASGSTNPLFPIVRSATGANAVLDGSPPSRCGQPTGELLGSERS